MTTVTYSFICHFQCARDQSISKNLNYNFCPFLSMYLRFPQDRITTFIHQQCDLLFHRLWYVNFCWLFILKIVFSHAVAYKCTVVVAQILMNMNCIAFNVQSYVHYHMSWSFWRAVYFLFIFKIRTPRL